MGDRPAGRPQAATAGRPDPYVTVTDTGRRTWLLRRQLWLLQLHGDGGWPPVVVRGDRERVNARARRMLAEVWDERRRVAASYTVRLPRSTDWPPR